MSTNIKNYITPLLLLLVTFLSVDGYSSMPLHNQYVTWVVYLLTSYYIIKINVEEQLSVFNDGYKIVGLFIAWAVISATRGLFFCENYWDWKNLIGGCFTIISLFFIYFLSDPTNLSRILSVWLKYATLFFAIFFIWVISRGSYHYYLTPFLVLGCFLPALCGKLKWTTIAAVLLMLFGDLGARTQIVAALMTLILAFALYLYKRGSYDFVERYLKYAQILFIILPLVLVTLGITGVFNVFKDLETNNSGHYSSMRVNSDGDLVEDDVAADTRTFIYVDVINSAVNNNYILFGRTPARGNDCTYALFADATFDLTHRYERYANEVGMTNIFTWYGLVGLILYCLIFLKATWVGMRQSNNIYVKIIACLVAFHFLWGWIEDYPAFVIHTITNWMMIAICLSESFRSMSDEDFEYWLEDITN